LVSLEEFLSVRAWFDVSEGTHDQPEGKKQLDSDDDDEEIGSNELPNQTLESDFWCDLVTKLLLPKIVCNSNIT